MRQNVIVPVAQDTIAAGFEKLCSLGIKRGILRMLTTIGFKDQLCLMAREVSDITPYADLPPEMSASRREPMA